MFLASASNAMIIGFNVRADASARSAVKETETEIRYYSIIYEAIDDVGAAINGLLSPEARENIIGLAEVKEVFVSPKLGNIAGSIVTEGINDVLIQSECSEIMWLYTKVSLSH